MKNSVPRGTIQSARRGRRRENKYHAERCEDSDGNKFDSKGERERWGALKLMQRAGVITDLELKPKLVVLVPRAGDAPQIGCRPDFAYRECHDGRDDFVYEDFKPRPMDRGERVLYKLWRHFGPAPLKITMRCGRNRFRTKECIPGKAQTDKEG